MKRYLPTLLLTLLAAAMVLTSCVKDNDDEVELSEKCIITGFTLGQLKRAMYLKTTAGMDSIYTTSFTGSYFPMTINQRELTIENMDSLPTRTRLDAVLTTATFDGLLFWRKAQLTADDDSTWTAYSTKDSLDLTQPLHMRIFSATGLSSRTYTLKVNVHQQRGDSTCWDSLGDVAALENVGQRRVRVWKGELAVWGLQTDGTPVCLKHALATSGAWDIKTLAGATGAQPETLQPMGDALYMSTTDGSILSSTDGIVWTATPYPALDGLRLVAASGGRLYALANGLLYSSDGGAWTEEALDDDSQNLPYEELNSVFYTTQYGMERLLLIGRNNATDTKAALWSKTWETGHEATEPWTYYTPNEADKYRCPLLKELCIVPYDNGLLALGGKSRDGENEALDSVLHSVDHGISWKTYTDDDMRVDPALQIQARQSAHIDAAVDDEHFLWVVLDKGVWRGRINRLGFLRQDK